MRKRLWPLACAFLFAFGCSSGGDEAPPEETENDSLQWGTIPSFQLEVGEAVDLDLRDYLTDTIGAATISLAGTLPGVAARAMA